MIIGEFKIIKIIAIVVIKDSLYKILALEAKEGAPGCEGFLDY